MYIENNERFLLLKLMNGLYGISLAENAVNTQSFLAKVIQFLKYYTSEESRLVRLKEELDILRLVVDLISASSGNQYSVSLDISDRELLNLYIPSKSLLMLVMEIFEGTKAAAAEAGCILMKVSQKEDAVMISIEDVCSSDLDKIQAMAEKVKKSFEILADSAVRVVSDCARPKAAGIVIKVKI